jgi:hypothetical protein
MKAIVLISSSILITLGFTIFRLIFAQPPAIEWSGTYGGDSNDLANSVCGTTDGGYIFVGYTKSFNADSNDVYVVKSDSLGNIQWHRLYGGDDYDEALSVQQTSDGGYIIAGATCSFGVGLSDMYLVKINSQGDTLCTRTYGRTYSDGARDVRQTRDGGYILAGSSTPVLGALIEMFLVKTDSMGDTLWTHTYGGSDNLSAYSVQQTFDGGYIVAGCNPLYGGIHDIHLFKTDSLGHTLWARTYGGVGEDDVRSLQQTADGGYILVGWTESFGAGMDDVYVIKTDSLGETSWTCTFGGSDYDWASDVQQTADEGYIISCNTSSYGTGESDLYLIRIDSAGDTLWTLVYGGPNYDMVTSVDLTNDGGYIVAGYIWDWDMFSDCWLVKIGPDTAVSGAPSIQWVSHPKDFMLHPAYPNPFNPVTTISYEVPVRGIVRVDVYNVLG